MGFLKKKKKIEDELGELDETPQDRIAMKGINRRKRESMTQTLLDRTKNDNDAICRHLGIDDQGHCLRPVSYTHLTLPTICSV